jgi:peptidyl-prolyl cis-trans isomerase B (cyclophilin B)
VAASKNQGREAREARERLKRYNARQAVHTHQVSRRRRDNIIAVVGVVVIAALAAVTQIFYFSAGPGKPTAAPSASASASPTATPTPAATANVGDVPAASVSENRTWTGDLTLNATKLGISLDGKAAPQAVASVVTDITDGYYDGKTCHRLLSSDSAGFIQCGSEDGTGASETDYSFGPIENAPADGVYKAGTIAMARLGDAAYSNGHQFFILFKDTTLPADSAGGYSVVGTVTSGLADLEKNITDHGIVPASAASDGSGTPAVTTAITAATIK